MVQYSESEEEYIPVGNTSLDTNATISGSLKQKSDCQSDTSYTKLVSTSDKSDDDKAGKSVLLYDEMLDRVTDVNNPEIFCRRLLKSSYTKFGQERRKQTAFTTRTTLVPLDARN